MCLSLLKTKLTEKKKVLLYSFSSCVYAHGPLLQVQSSVNFIRPIFEVQNNCLPIQPHLIIRRAHSTTNSTETQQYWPTQTHMLFHITH